VFRGRVLLVRRGVGQIRGGGLPKSPAAHDFRPAADAEPGIVVPAGPAVEGFRGRVEGFRVPGRPFQGIRLPPGSWAQQFRVRVEPFRGREEEFPGIYLPPGFPVQGFRGIYLRPGSPVQGFRGICLPPGPADQEFLGIYAWPPPRGFPEGSAGRVARLRRRRSAARSPQALTP